MFSELDGERPLLLSVAEAHRKLGIGRTMFYAELQAGRIRSIKVGARRMVPMSALKAYVDDRLAEADE
jgi:excisionase family DNA binding protein